MDNKIIHMPGANLSPEVLLHQTLEDAGNIKSIIILVQDDQGAIDTYFSTQSLSELTFASKILEIKCNDLIKSSMNKRCR